MKKLILLFLSIILKFPSTFCFYIDDLSSSSSSSNNAIKSSNSQELEQEIASFKNKKLPLTPFQMKMFSEIKKIEAIKYFPLGLAELIVSYKSEEHDANKRLLDILRNARLNSEEEIEIVKELVNDGANVNHENYGEYLQSPLCCVIESFWLNPPKSKKLIILRIELIKFLVEKGANVNASNFYEGMNNTPLTDIIVGNKLRTQHKLDVDQMYDIVKFLLDNKANPNIGFRRFNLNDNPNNDTLLIRSLDGPKEIFKLLLEYGANPDVGTDILGRQFVEIINHSQYDEHRKIFNAWQKEKSKNTKAISSSSKCVIS